MLKTLPEPDPERSAALADTILGGAVASAGTRVLGEGGVWPERGTVCVGAYDGFALVGYDRLGPDRPSDISGWIDAVSPTGGAHGVFMHSVVDYCAFAVWEGGELRRSVSLAPDSGVMEDLGDRLSFEAPFWDGKHPMDEGYPLPFHPLEFGEAALGACFGFGIEGDPSTYEFDPFAFTVPAFRLAE
ncbi:hypothetical protein [Glycomyces sp. NRRL B-16210]|uniref:DUF6928 family protein n=1 Tax=Glycomyces sp. NRRL B-16210 TaxID=1463821 RepID=UPI001061CFF7|nr:hypothetical protein [Glycomyces sp. NRRL B-16210]